MIYDYLVPFEQKFYTFFFGLYSSPAPQLLRKKELMLVNIHYWQAVGRQRGIKMSTREMKDHTPLLTPLKASDQSRTIGELKLKKQNQTKHSSLHPGYTLCPRLTLGSSLGQHGQQEMVERGFTQNTSYVALSVCSLLSYQVHNSLSIFYLAVHFFTYNPKPQSPRDRRI